MNKSIILSMACCLIGWASQTEAQIVQDRSDAFNMNAKLGNGIVFGSIMWTFENTNRYDVRDFELAREHDFNHVRICARMQNMQTSTGVLSDEAMDQLIAIIDDALANDLIAVICPFFWWKATLANEPPAFSNGDITALADMWEQIAIRCKEEGYGLEDVVFELYEEPEIGIDVERLIAECVDKITAVENRYIIIPGRGFRTIVGMGRVLNDDHIPLDYDRLIGTFHFYEPKCEFCNLYQSACGVTTEPSAYIPWPNQTYDEAALRSWFVTLDQQNANWASRNGTVKLPMYMGEFGTLNKPSTGNIAGRFDLPREERKHWIWWTRMVAEEYGYSTAYWNAYGNNSFGLGNWDILNPAARNMADPNDPTDEELIRHSLLGRYEAEDLKSVASISGFTIGSDTQTSHDYLSFQGSAPNQGLKFDDVYVGMDGVYNVSIRFSNAHATELQLDVQSQEPDSAPLTSRTAVPFAITGDSNWYAKTIPMQLKAGINTIEFSGTTGDLRIDYIGVTQVDKVFLDQGYETLATDDRAGTSSDLPVQTGLVLHLDASRLSGYAEGDLIELWSNLAVAGTHVSSGNASSRPTYQANVFNGKPAVRFDGVDDWMDLGDMRTDAGPFEVFVVTQSSDTEDGNWQNLISSFTSGPDNFTAPNWSLLRPHEGGTPLSVAPSILSKNESAGFSLDGLGLARRGFDQGAFYGGDIAESIIYDRALEAWERNQVEYHLAYKYGLDIESYVNGADDADQDGYSDYAELIAGTLLNDSKDYFSVAFSASSENVRLQWESNAARDYTILRSYDLIDWQAVETVSGDDLQKFFEESLNPSENAFYRIEISHP